MSDLGGEREATTGTESGAGVHSEAWAATIEDMQETAAELERNGWSVLTLTAGDTSAEAPSDGESDRFGMVYVVGDDDGEAFEEAHDAGTFPRYEVYRGERAGRVFLVTVLLDPGTETAILLAGTYERDEARGCLRAAAESGTMYTHLHLLDGTHLGSFEHESYEKFFPDDMVASVVDEGEGTVSDEGGSDAAGDDGDDATG